MLLWMVNLWLRGQYKDTRVGSYYIEGIFFFFLNSLIFTVGN